MKFIYFFSLGFQNLLARLCQTILRDILSSSGNANSLQSTVRPSTKCGIKLFLVNLRYNEPGNQQMIQYLRSPIYTAPAAIV